VKTPPHFGLFSRFVRVIGATLLAGCAAQPLVAATTWNQFRGPNGQGVAEDARPPVTFSPQKNVIWKAGVGQGHSSPVLWENRIFLTTFHDRDLETVCLDRETGREVWRKAVTAGKLQKTHEMSNAAASTPAVDKDRLYAYFGSYGVVCYDHDGKELWQRNLPPAKNHYGGATSPILHDGHLILLLDADDGSSQLLALKQASGEKAWETPRPLFKAGWTTPMVWSNGTRDEIVALGSGRLEAYDATNGKELWWVGGFPPETIQVPVDGDGLLFAGSATLGGRGDPKYDADRSWRAIKEFDKNGDGKIQREEMTKDFAIPLRFELPKDNPGYAFPNRDSDALLRSFDRDGDGAIGEQEWKNALADFVNLQPALLAVRSGAAGDARKTHVAWEIHRHIPEIPSPLYYRKRLYLVSDGGLFTCLDPANGQDLFSERLDAPGQYAASPVGADGRIYAASENGVITVLEAGDKLRILAKNDLGGKIFATPALHERRLYVRTTTHLYAFGE
jgi:outer membrane protein assembly factor BamB